MIGPVGVQMGGAKQGDVGVGIGGGGGEGTDGV